MENTNANPGYASILDEPVEAAPQPQAAPQPMPQGGEQPIAPLQPEGQTPTPEQPKKKSKAPLIIVIVLIVIILAGGGIAAAIILPSVSKKNELLDTAAGLIEKVKAQDDDKLVYFFRDLKKISPELAQSPYGLDYHTTSYASRYDGNVKLCLSDGERRVTNYSGELKIEDEVVDCKYELSDDDVTKYLVNYYNKNKDLNLKKDDIKMDEGEFVFETEKGAVYTSVEKTKNGIGIEDDFDVFEYDLEDQGELCSVIKRRTLKMLGIKEFANDSAISDVSEYDNLIMIDTTYRISEAKAYAEKLQKYLSSKKLQNAIIAVYRPIYVGELTDPNFHSEINYAIGLYYQDGKTKIEVRSQQDTADKPYGELDSTKL